MADIFVLNSGSVIVERVVVDCKFVLSLMLFPHTRYKLTILQRSPILNNQMVMSINSEMYTPVKGVKGMPDCIKKRVKAADDLFSTAVSRVRQPIEAAFNWLIEKVDIQRASKVRSTKGLLVHAFGKLAAAFIHLLF